MDKPIAGYLFRNTVRSMCTKFLALALLFSPILTVDPEVPTEGAMDNSNIIPDSTEPVLTPWWDLTFSEGETVEVDCGVYTGGDPKSTTIIWKGPSGKPLKVHDRVTVIRRDINHEHDDVPSSYSVRTFTMTNVTAADNGVYTCTVNGNKTANISLTVVKPTERCGFEGPDLCGWTIDGASEVTWHVHDGADDDIINRTKGTRYDHTYGPTKHIGHFLDVDLQHSPTNTQNTTAMVQSPLYMSHNTPQCLQFWYIFEGRDQGGLSVSLHRTNDSEDITQQLWQVGRDQGNEWKLATVQLVPQPQDYHLIFEAVVCTDKCRLAATAIDDISVTEGKCTDQNPQWPKNQLPVRLVGGKNPREGRVEILHDGQWGSVCSKEFGNKEAMVICNYLGFNSQYPQGRRNGQYGQSPETSMIWLERLRCTGKETDLAACIIPGETWGATNCNHQEDAGVICTDVPPPTTPEPFKTFPPMLPMPESTPTPESVPETVSFTTSKPKSTTTILPAPQDPSQIPTQSIATGSDITKPSPTESTTPKSTPTTTTTTSTTTTTTINPNTTTTKVTIPPKKTTTTTTAKPTTTTTIKSTTTTEDTFIRPGSPKPKLPVSSSTEKLTPTPKSQPAEDTDLNPGIASLPPDVEQYSSGSHTGVAVGIIIAVILVTTGLGILLYRRKRKGKKSTYITFGNPSYSREHLPANDFSLESPLTLSSNGYTVLA